MATRGIIARKTGEQTFEGRYHHWDSYFEGLGEALCELYTGHFQRDIKAMLIVLIDEHPAGWSSINGCDFTLPPGFRDDLDHENNQPECYCHGARHEEGYLYTALPHPDQTDIEWVYVFDEQTHVMTVYHIDHYIQKEGRLWTRVKTINLAELPREQDR